MQLSERVHLVGSGILGLSVSDPYDCNVYLVDGGSQHALIDAGAGYRPAALFDAMTAAGFDPAAIDTILLTHKHPDHSGGASALVSVAGAEVLGSQSTADVVSDSEAVNRSLERVIKAGAYPCDYVFTGIPDIRIVAPGDVIQIGDVGLEVIATPGHCAGHCSFVMAGSEGPTVFSGDALFPCGQILLQAIPDCSLGDSLASVQKLAHLRPHALLAGHQAPALHDGWRHANFALDRIRAGRIPQQLVLPG